MTSATALTLLGFGLGALLVAGNQPDPRGPRTLRERAGALRGRALAAQQNSARASLLARELTACWSEAEDAARRDGR